MSQYQGRHFLQIPGPSPVPDRVLRAMDMPVIDHRSAEFAELGKAVFEGCRKVFKTAGPVIILIIHRTIERDGSLFRALERQSSRLSGVAG